MKITGLHHINNAMAAACGGSGSGDGSEKYCGRSLGVSVRFTDGWKLSQLRNGAYLLDDSYNAIPHRSGSPDDP